MPKTYTSSLKHPPLSTMTFRLDGEAAGRLPAPLVTNSPNRRNRSVLLEHHADGSVTLRLKVDGHTEHFLPSLLDLVSTGSGHVARAGRNATPRFIPE